MSLVLDQIGVTVLKPGGGVGAVLPWAGAVAASTVDRRAPHARTARRRWSLEATTHDPHTPIPGARRRPGRARAPSSTRWLRRAPAHGPDGAAAGGPPALVALGVLVVAGVALALLVTVGGVKL